MSCEPIQRILVVGTHRLTGAALAARWAERYDIVTHAADDAEHCESVIASADADVIVYCGPASEPSWSPLAAEGLDEEAVANASRWAQVSGDRFVAITSDAIFTGPYMFHAEACEHRCQTPEASVLAAIEAAIAEVNESALIVRTHIFSPGSGEAAPANNLVDQILAEEDVQIAGAGHATPIYAADLADLIECAIVDETTGTMHIAGAERLSPFAFAERLREAFDQPRRTTTLFVGEHESGFASGDRGLICREARERLGVSMPLLTDGFARMRKAIADRQPRRVRIAA